MFGKPGVPEQPGCLEHLLGQFQALGCVEHLLTPYNVVGPQLPIHGRRLWEVFSICRYLTAIAHMQLINASATKRVSTCATFTAPVP